MDPIQKAKLIRELEGREWLSFEEAEIYGGFETRYALTLFLSRHKVPRSAKGGGSVNRNSLDKALGRRNDCF